MEDNNNLDGFLEAFLNDPQTRKWFETQQAFQNEESNQNLTKEHEMSELEKLSNQNRFDRGDAMQRVNQAMDNAQINESLDERQLNKKSRNKIRQALDKYAKEVFGDKYGTENKALTDLYFHNDSNGRKVTNDADITSGIFSIGNKKLSDDTLIINFTSALGCPSMNSCPITQAACYAVAGENRLPDTRRKNLIVQNLVKAADANNMLQGLFDIMLLYIEEAAKTSKPIKFIRYNEAGDFPNQRILEYSARFSKMVKEKYNVMSMAYTARTTLDPSQTVDGTPIDQIIKINRSVDTIKASEGSIKQNFNAIEMKSFSTDPNINLEEKEKYTDVVEISDAQANKLQIVAPLPNENGVNSIPVLRKGSWDGGAGYYYICPCSFWKYNKDKATDQFLMNAGLLENGVTLSDKDRIALVRELTDADRAKLKSLLNKVDSPCGRQCAVCHDMQGGVDMETGEKNIKNYTVLTATHGATAGNYDAKYAQAKRGGKNATYNGVRKLNTDNYGHELKYINAQKERQAEPEKMVSEAQINKMIKLALNEIIRKK